MMILLVSNMYPSKKDKLFGIFVFNFIESLSRLGINFETVVIEGKRITRISKLIGYLKFYLIGVFKIAFFSGDIIYFHFVSHCAPLIIFARLLRSKSILIVNVHGSDVLGKRSVIKDFLVKRALNDSSGIVTPSEYFNRVVLDNVGHHLKDRIISYPSGGIDLSKFKASEYHNFVDSTRLGFASRIVEEKGWKDFLDALKILDEEGFPFEATIAGRGRDDARLLDYLQKLDIKNKVKFSGYLNQQQLAQLFQEIDVFVFPSRRLEESLGLVGIEAMACGAPVVGSDMAGIATYVDNGGNGFLFSPGDPEDLAVKLKAFIRLSEDEKQQLRSNAIATSVDYDSQVVNKKLVDWLHAFII